MIAELAPRKKKGSNTPPKTEPTLSAEGVRLSILQRFNPIRGLTPQSLSLQLDNFNLGYLAYCALTWDAIERRDDVLKGVASKRKKDVARLEREVLTIEESPEAAAHAEALTDFYDHLECVNALDESERGGFPLLVRQMMDAVGKKYAVHEVVWKPGDEGQPLTAELRFTPLWFFENRTGRLQFITTLGQATGEPLEPGGWMITTGDGLMEPCSVAYMYKHLPLRDWLAYSDKFGTPGILGRTNAAQGSDAGLAMRSAVSSFGQNWSGVLYGDDGQIENPISLITPETATTLPFPGLIERMDRTMAALWRGADLSTMSGSQESNVGASVQGDESDILLADDAAMISETLHYYLDRWVIWQRFGTDRPLARVKLSVPDREDTELDLKVDDWLLKAGAPLGTRERMEHYGRAQIQKGDQPLALPAAPTEPDPNGGNAETANERATVRRLETLLGEALANANPNHNPRPAV